MMASLLQKVRERNLDRWLPGYARALGRRIGKDLAMVLVDALPGWAVGGGVPTFIVPNYAVGMEGVELLLEKIDHPRRALPSRVLPFAFDPGHDQTPRF